MSGEPETADGIADRIRALIQEAGAVLATHRPNPSNVIGFPTLDSGAFARWRSRASALLDRVAGPDHRYTKAFDERVTQEYRSAVKAGCGLLESFLADYEAGDFAARPEDSPKALDQICLIAERFHAVTRQLRSRHDSRATLDVNDEYDAQDLLHALFRLFFEDVRVEEWTPSYAGGCSRIDFLLKAERIIVEVKKARPTLKARDLGTQLIDDIARYRTHPDCEVLVCFVYDPEGLIANPRGVEADLSRRDENMATVVLIRPA